MKYRNIIAACRVLQGFYGYGEERIRRLTADGYDYYTVQRIVNRLLQGLPPYDDDGTAALDPDKVRERIRALMPDQEEIEALVNEMAEDILK